MKPLSVSFVLWVATITQALLGMGLIVSQTSGQDLLQSALPQSPLRKPGFFMWVLMASTSTSFLVGLVAFALSAITAAS